MQDVCKNLLKMTIASTLIVTHFREHFFREISLRFRIFRFIHFREKVCEIRTKNESARSKKPRRGEA